MDIGDSRFESKVYVPTKGLSLKEGDGRDQVQDRKYDTESDIVIGFDFGTSSSKIVIRDSGRQTAYAVPFGSLACSGNSHLIPTRIFISDDGEISLSAGDHCYSDLKARLTDNPEEEIFTATNTSISITASELVAAYMAEVIRISRSWFLQCTEVIYKTTHIFWHINLGIPSDIYDEMLGKRFQTIVAAAWRISRIDGSIAIAEVKDILKGVRNLINTKEKNDEPNNNETLWLHPDFVNIHPEVIMEVVGYVKSASRTSGLHLLIDVGAATLDTATFIIHRNEGDIYPLMETKVTQHGTMVLHQRRVESLKNHLQNILQQLNTIDPTSPLPDTTHYEITMAKNIISENDDNFFEECSVEIGTVIRDTKNRRDPHSDVWNGMMPVFICGGGGRLSAYRDMITKRGTDIAKSLKDFKGFTIKEIPKSDDLDAQDMSPQDYDRLAVAYGLSFTSDEIGSILAKNKISDIHKGEKVKQIEVSPVDKDMV